MDDDGIQVEPVKVIFRKWPGTKDVIALFPEIPGSYVSSLCQSYEHVGQHGSASESIMRYTKHASLQEAQELMEELVHIGYVPVVVKRFTKQAREKRQKEIDKWRS